MDTLQTTTNRNEGGKPGQIPAGAEQETTERTIFISIIRGWRVLSIARVLQTHSGIPGGAEEQMAAVVPLAACTCQTTSFPFPSRAAAASKRS